jgi:hypothetical protein
MQFCDNAALLETLQDVEGLPGRTCSIRSEGGMYMTLRSTMCTTIREVNVVYVPTPRQSC